MMEWVTQDTPLHHICEVCGKDEVLSPRQAHAAGWDYPPGIGAFGVVSPRTCPEHLVTATLWWRVTMNPNDPISEADTALLERIKGEPESIRVEDT